MSDLFRLIKRVDGFRAGLPEAKTYKQMIAQVSANEKAARAFIATLEIEEGARVRDDCHAKALSLGGIRVSCTAGWCGVLRNWSRAALRKLGRDGHTQNEARR